MRYFFFLGLTWQNLRCEWNQGNWSCGETKTLPSTIHLDVDHKKLGRLVTSRVEKGCKWPGAMCETWRERGVRSSRAFHLRATSW